MKQSARLAIILAAFILMSISRGATARQQEPQNPDLAVKGADIFCTGYISEAPPRSELQVIGGEMENIRYSFTQGDVVYLNRGRESGVHSGAAYYIIRPMGEIKHPFTKKKIGYLVREIGLLRVLEVHDKAATAEITVSCDLVEFGDFLKPFEGNPSPGLRDARPLPRYGEGSGDIKGQIIMTREMREYIAANQIVYIDLGLRQGVKPGDYFTIYRQINRREGATKIPEDDVVQDRSGGFYSDRYRGGDFSVQANPVPGKKVMRERPELPRKVLGELIVLKVEKTAAVAIVTRTTSEVNVGDFIERSH